MCGYRRGRYLAMARGGDIGNKFRITSGRAERFWCSARLYLQREKRSKGEPCGSQRKSLGGAVFLHSLYGYLSSNGATDGPASSGVSERSGVSISCPVCIDHR